MTVVVVIVWMMEMLAVLMIKRMMVPMKIVKGALG